MRCWVHGTETSLSNITCFEENLQRSHLVVMRNWCMWARQQPLPWHEFNITCLEENLQRSCLSNTGMSWETSLDPTMAMTAIATPFSTLQRHLPRKFSKVSINQTEAQEHYGSSISTSQTPPAHHRVFVWTKILILHQVTFTQPGLECNTCLKQ